MTATRTPDPQPGRTPSPHGSTSSAPTGRVVAQHRGRWLIADPSRPGEHDARPAILSGRLARDPSPDAHPVVGDQVALDPDAADGLARITGVLPRRSLLRRGATDGTSRQQALAANVDVAFVVVPADRAVNPRRIEREVTLVWESGALPVVLLTKMDLCADPDAAVAAASGAAAGVEVVPISVHDRHGLHVLDHWLVPGATVVLLGASGAGKSTLTNHLLGREHLRTNGLRWDGAGRHTTTHRELVALPGGAAIIDTPGLRALALWADGGDEEATALGQTFGDVATLALECRFADCGHRREPGCAVLAAVADGRLPADRLASWEALGRELAQLERRRDAVARAAGKAADRRGAKALRVRVAEKRGEG
ncbi:ribosome small subunit-dependent GTPase A [Roseisolibacter agri]|uniref:Small ribosomal subunit biogenesis GTPase RsgA n=1 Tax=Roseisolibacter agri TaxID=2014610 RepID=A0AA37V197_9BACT|nr:ribosome small subunit-dependent GTPase A [Roseisolibacter agri]GLC25840.1 putative ribosome biogenesis GTPase RsgA [Roseisolibacter agri]